MRLEDELLEEEEEEAAAADAEGNGGNKFEDIGSNPLLSLNDSLLRRRGKVEGRMILLYEVHAVFSFSLLILLCSRPYQQNIKISNKSSGFGYCNS